MREVRDGPRHTQGYTFVLLAASAAAKAGPPEDKAISEDVWEQPESPLFEPTYGLYADEIAPGDWPEVDPQPWHTQRPKKLSNAAVMTF
jgi:mannose/cellobiose epimerase-like protein (N-acyl-D-glucosamine 2-epimerase family)